MSAWGVSFGEAWGDSWGSGTPTPPPPDEAIVSDGLGGAHLIYKLPHKKVHDEIEGYFARLTETEADGLLMEAQVLVGSEEARHAVANSLHQRAVERVARMIEDERRDELRALLALAQDEDDAEAVVLMLETLH